MATDRDELTMIRLRSAGAHKALKIIYRGEPDGNIGQHFREDVPALLAEIDRLAADLRMERVLRRRAEERHHEADVDNRSMARQRDQVRAIVTTNGYEGVGTEATGSAAGRRLVNKRVLDILDREAS